MGLIQRFLCACRAALRGANNCIYDTRAMASEMQRTYADSSQGNGEGYSWRHYTDNCNACPGGNTNSYGPDNLFDDPITYPSGGGDFLSDTGYTAGWVAVNLTVPTLITGYKLRARNWNEFPKTFRFQGSNDWVNWVDIEVRSTESHKMQTSEERIFWVGVPSDVPGIPTETMTDFSANPFQYEGTADTRNICVLGDNDATRGRGTTLMPPPPPPDGGH